MTFTFRNLLSSVFFLLLSFPLFYFTYKFANPEPLAHDFFQYYRLYLNMDIAQVNAPFNMRLVGAMIVHLFYKLNLFYDTETAFDVYRNWGFLKQVYFDAVLFNWLCVAGTCTFISMVLRERGIGWLPALGGGLLYLLGFGTIFYHLMPLTDACSTLMFVWFLFYYLKKSNRSILPLVLLVFQREYILLAVLLLAAMDGLKWKKKYFLKIVFTAGFCFAIYYTLRKTLFYTPALDFQSQPGTQLQNLFSPALNWGQYWKQFLLTGNLLLLYAGIIIFKYYKKMEVAGFELLKIAALFLQVHLLSIAGGHGNNAGRYFYLVIPLVIVQIVLEVHPLIRVHPLPNNETRSPLNNIGT